MGEIHAQTTQHGITVTQAAEQLHISEKTVRAWLKSGKLNGYKLGKSWRVMLGDGTIPAQTTQSHTKLRRFTPNPAAPNVPTMNTKRQRGTGSISQQKGKWRAEIKVNEARKRKTFTNLEDAHEWLDQLAMSARNVGTTNALETSLRELFVLWAATWDIGHGEKVGRNSAINYINDIAGDECIGTMTPADVKRISHAIGEIVSTTTKKPLSVDRANYLFRQLKSALKWATEEGILLRNVADGIKRPRKRNEDITPSERALEPDDMQLLLAYLRELECTDCPRGVCPARWVIGLHGLRQGEALALKWVDIKFGDDPRIIVRRTQRQTNNGWEVVNTTKTGAAGRREIPITQATVERLIRHKQACVSSEWVFPGLRDSSVPATKQTDSKRWGRLQKEAGLSRHYPLHGLRHSVATELANQSVPLAMSVLGHRNITTTMGYVARRGDGASEVLKKWDV